jgi:DNA-binding transcriptional LysR family regulator
MAWLPESLVRDEISRGDMVPASVDPHWDLTTEIRIYRHDAPLSPRAESLWTYLQTKDGAVSENSD